MISLAHPYFSPPIPDGDNTSSSIFSLTPFAHSASSATDSFERQRQVPGKGPRLKSYTVHVYSTKRQGS